MKVPFLLYVFERKRRRREERSYENELWKKRGRRNLLSTVYMSPYLCENLWKKEMAQWMSSSGVDAVVGLLKGRRNYLLWKTKEEKCLCSRMGQWKEHPWACLEGHVYIWRKRLCSHGIAKSNGPMSCVLWEKRLPENVKYSLSWISSSHSSHEEREKAKRERKKRAPSYSSPTPIHAALETMSF